MSDVRCPFGCGKTFESKDDDEYKAHFVDEQMKRHQAAITAGAAASHPADLMAKEYAGRFLEWHLEHNVSIDELIDLFRYALKRVYEEKLT